MTFSTFGSWFVHCLLLLSLFVMFSHLPLFFLFDFFLRLEKFFSFVAFFLCQLLLLDFPLRCKKFVRLAFDAFEFFRLFVVVSAVCILLNAFLEFGFVHLHVITQHTDLFACRRAVKLHVVLLPSFVTEFDRENFVATVWMVFEFFGEFRLHLFVQHHVTIVAGMTAVLTHCISGSFTDTSSRKLWTTIKFVTAHISIKCRR